MARQPRYRLPGVPQHIVHRGRSGRRIFSSEKDYRFYLDCLEAASRRYQCAVHAYVLMPDHVHLLVTPFIAEGIARLMQTVGRRYVRYSNRLYQGHGTLWEGRYRATVIDGGRHFLACACYVDLNPVRAQLVDAPEKYLWSSYGVHAGYRKDSIISGHTVFETLGSTDEDRFRTYQELCRRNCDSATLSAIREATYSGWAYGSDEFQQRIESLLNRRVRPLPRGGPRRKLQTEKEML